MTTETADPIDVHAGKRLRARRKALGLSQQTLGEKLGVSFQQIQKYERGTNRISFSTLVRAAHVLGVEIDYFAEGLETEGDSKSHMKVRTDPSATFFAAEGSLRLAKDYLSLPRSQQRVIADLARGLRDAKLEDAA